MKLGLRYNHHLISKPIFSKPFDVHPLLQPSSQLTVLAPKLEFCRNRWLLCAEERSRRLFLGGVNNSSISRKDPVWGQGERWEEGLEPWFGEESLSTISCLLQSKPVSSYSQQWSSAFLIPPALPHNVAACACSFHTTSDPQASLEASYSSLPLASPGSFLSLPCSFSQRLLNSLLFPWFFAEYLLRAGERERGKWCYPFFGPLFLAMSLEAREIWGSGSCFVCLFVF